VKIAGAAALSDDSLRVRDPRLLNPNQVLEVVEELLSRREAGRQFAAALEEVPLCDCAACEALRSMQDSGLLGQLNGAKPKAEAGAWPVVFHEPCQKWQFRHLANCPTCGVPLNV